MEIPNEVFGQPNNTLYISSWTKFCVFKIPKLHLFHSRKLSLSWVVTVTQHSVMCPVGFHSSAQFSSVSQSCPTLCDPMDHSSSGLPVHHQLPEFTQTHVHRVGDAIKTSHPLSSPSPPAFNLSQNQGLFKRVSFSYQVAKVLEIQFQHQFSQWTPRTDLL